MSNPRRRRYSPHPPRDAKRRSWVVTIDVIEGEIYVLAVSHPGVLRPKLQTLCD
jgi:hypothetical protein